LTQDNIYDIILSPSYCPVIGQNTKCGGKENEKTTVVGIHIHCHAALYGHIPRPAGLGGGL
jgi:hypothetical protein